MPDKTWLKEELKKFLPEVREPKDIFKLFDLLNYPKDCFFDTSYKRNLEEIGLRSEEKNKIKNIYTVLNFQKNLAVALIEVETLSSGLVKYLAKFGYRKLFQLYFFN